MKRTLIIVAVVTLAGVAIAGMLYGRDVIDGMRYEKAMHQIGETNKANAGPWPQPQEACFVCHGPRGQSLNAWYPALSGQPKAYIAAQLHAFASDQRPNAYMGPLAKDLTDAEIDAFAIYFAKQTPARNEDVPADAALETRGLALVQARSCQACHGGNLMGKDQVPRLAGQGADYLAKQLTDFKTGARKDPTGAMNGAASMLSSEDIPAVARYLAGMTPEHDGAVAH
ncbi:c-type cytochrome [Cupriavidus consociatus]|uniref:c-type cytochrome n=1 Tax=Cupriavidus consociatus TaxID=2821357 RepID=UPI001AE722DB|nr:MULTISPECIES: c-type cytochrome [unclassified Cupriavidus]MBP0620902.1 c-type cytochrome [Cupriavidus sp. LEh25]MDK2657567.1 c-type cytochrome [Cupriavidus sp. LEh21]